MRPLHVSRQRSFDLRRRCPLRSSGGRVSSLRQRCRNTERLWCHRACETTGVTDPPPRWITSARRFGPHLQASLPQPHAQIDVLVVRQAVRGVEAVQRSEHIGSHQQARSRGVVDRRSARWAWNWLSKSAGADRARVAPVIDHRAGLLQLSVGADQCRRDCADSRVSREPRAAGRASQRSRVHRG